MRSDFCTPRLSQIAWGLVARDPLTSAHATAKFFPYDWPKSDDIRVDFEFKRAQKALFRPAKTAWLCGSAVSPMPLARVACPYRCPTEMASSEATSAPMSIACSSGRLIRGIELALSSTSSPSPEGPPNLTLLSSRLQRR